jgi:hypothetical protein
MPASSDDMIASLDAFEADAEYDSNQFRLYRLTDGFKVLPDRERLVPSMFALMERYPDAHLGTPGPLVHCIESLGVLQYEDQLIESVRRQPAELSVWMVNRILNSKLDSAHRAKLLELLHSVVHHPAASPRVVESANQFLAHQATRETG